LIVVSDDLQFFSHLHPTLKGNGEFEVSANFPAAGSYSIFSDYKPTGKPEQVSVLKTNVAGTAPVAIAPDFGRSKTIDSTKVDFSVPEVRAEHEVTVTFDLKDINSNRAIQDLQPYLGERGHLVTLKQSSPLTRADYIHAHAMKDTPDGKISFMTTFPQAGKYKLWGQFNRAGKIVVADFWVNVQSAKAASSLSTPHQH
jgi:plastocyanin